MMNYYNDCVDKKVHKRIEANLNPCLIKDKFIQF